MYLLIGKLSTSFTENNLISTNQSGFRPGEIWSDRKTT